MKRFLKISIVSIQNIVYYSYVILKEDVTLKIQQAKRMSIFEPSIFSRLSEVTEKRKKDGDSVIDLSLGSPDLPPASFVRERLSKTSADSSRYG